jgi:hypothetical protein
MVQLRSTKPQCQAATACVNTSQRNKLKRKCHHHHHHHHMALVPKSGPDLPCWGFVKITFLQGWIVSPAPNPHPGDQASVFMTPGDRVVQLYPQTLGTQFSRLLRYAWVTVGLFFNPGHHTGLS